MRLEGYDLVISSSHCVAKGIRKPPGAKHLAYVHAPMRYMWDLFDDYFGPGRASLPVRVAAHAVRPCLQKWDRESTAGVDRILVNSQHIAGKVKRFWGREASVVHPPIALDRFCQHPLEGLGQGGYYLWLGAFAPYKRLDIALEAFRHLDAPLWVVGTGQEAAKLTSGPLPSHIRFLGSVPNEALAGLYRDARALIFTPEEDFGIVPLEAQACGRPVIAYGRGGALETVSPRTGLFFDEQTPDALVDAVRRFEQWEPAFQPADARAQAERFSRAAFLRKVQAEVDAMMGAPPSPPAGPPYPDTAVLAGAFSEGAHPPRGARTVGHKPGQPLGFWAISMVGARPAAWAVRYRTARGSGVRRLQVAAERLAGHRRRPACSTGSSASIRPSRSPPTW